MKQSIVLAFFIAFCFSVHAQEYVRFGLKAGINSSALNTNIESAQISSLQSFYAGGMAIFTVSKSFSIQSELIYSEEGTMADPAKMEFNYLRLPLLFQYNHVSGFHVEAGPQIGIMLEGKAYNKDTKEELESENQLTKASTSIAIGFGYRMKNGLGIDVRYAKGIDNPIGGQKARLVVASGGLSFAF